MPDSRRLRRFALNPEQLIGLLKGTAAVVERPLPADAKFHHGYWSTRYGAFQVTVASSEFEPVPPCTPIPPTLNGPVISEIQP